MVGSMIGRLTTVFILAAVLTTAGCNQLFDSPTEPSPPLSPNTVGYTALGASDAIGYGSSIVCAPLDTGCENGTGYVQTLRRRLMADGKTVVYLNLGIPGAVLSRTIEDLAANIGRPVPGNFIERQAPFVPPTTTVVTVFAGGNDANVIAQAVLAGRGGSDRRGYIDQQIRQWGDDYATLIGRLRDRAPSARVIVLNLPNLAAAPYVAGNSVAERSVLQYIAVGLSDQANALGSQGVSVIDLMCTDGIYAPGSYSADGFHPSDQGYALMADLVWPVLTGGSAPAPSTNCPARTRLPAF